MSFQPKFSISPKIATNLMRVRLLTTLILHLGGYDLKGLYSLEEYYAGGLGQYYNALAIRRVAQRLRKAERTPTLQSGWSISVAAWRKASKACGGAPWKRPAAGRRINRPRCAGSIRDTGALQLFQLNEFITGRDVEALFGISQRAARNLLSAWVADGFADVAEAAKKTRKYALRKEFTRLLE